MTITEGMDEHKQPELPQPAPINTNPRPICQLCGGRLIEIRAKLQCERCHTIWETCCEGGPQ